MSGPGVARRPSTTFGGPPPPASRGEDLRFAGYAALFDVVDRGGDVVRRGAFAASLARARGMLPLLWEHDVSRPIGLVTAVEDARGLRVDGRVSVRTAAGREAARMLGEGAVRGLSFGYRVREARGERPRALLGVDVVEVSVVRAPMQLGARVDRALRVDAPLSDYD